MALHYNKKAKRFYDDHGGFVSNARGMRSSIAHPEYYDSLQEFFDLETFFSSEKKTKDIPSDDFLLTDLDFYKQEGEGNHELELEDDLWSEDDAEIYENAEFQEVYLSDLGITSLSELAPILKKKYPKSNKWKYIYRKPSDLKKKSTKIDAYYTLEDKNNGLHLWKFTWNDRDRTVESWRRFLKKDADAIFKSKILPSLNTKMNTNYKFKAITAWSLTNALPKHIDTGTRKSWNKTRKARKK